MISLRTVLRMSTGEEISVGLYELDTTTLGSSSCISHIADSFEVAYRLLSGTRKHIYKQLTDGYAPGHESHATAFYCIGFLLMNYLVGQQFLWF